MRIYATTHTQKKAPFEFYICFAFFWDVLQGGALDCSLPAFVAQQRALRRRGSDIQLPLGCEMCLAVAGGLICQMVD